MKIFSGLSSFKINNRFKLTESANIKPYRQTNLLIYTCAQNYSHPRIALLLFTLVHPALSNGNI